MQENQNNENNNNEQEEEAQVFLAFLKKYFLELTGKRRKSRDICISA